MSDLIYPYVRDRQVQSREEFCRRHPHVVLVYKHALNQDVGDTQTAPALTADIAAAVRMMRKEAHRYRVFVLKPATSTLIGRSVLGDGLTIAEPSVSHEHAHIEVHADGSAVLVDHGSTNGTSVDDFRLTARTPFALKPGQVVHFAQASVPFLGPAELFDFLTTLIDPRATPGRT